MAERKYVPVRYLDRLMRLTDRLRLLRYTIEGMDPEVEAIMEDIECRLGEALMALNRDEPDRTIHLAKARGDAPSP